MKLSNYDHIDIIGGNVSGLVAGIELSKKRLPFMIYEKGIWDKPCGGAFGQNFHKYLKENHISLNTNLITNSVFASKYGKIDEIPYKFYITKRKHLQEELMKKIPENNLKIEKVDKKDIKKMSKIIFVATGISGLSKYLLKKDFPYLGRYQYYLLKYKDFPAWDSNTSLFYWIPEIQGYAWVFPTINGFVDIGIGGFENANQKKYYGEFLNWLSKNYDLKNPKKVMNKTLVSWGIPMWSPKIPKKIIHYERTMKQLRIGLGDAVDLPQIVSAGGIENAINSSQLLVDSITHLEPNTLDIDIDHYINGIFHKLPLRSNIISVRLAEKIVYSHFLLHPSIFLGKLGNKLITRFTSNLTDLLKG